jgi:hypothetical protein
MNILRNVQSIDTPIGGIGWKAPIDEADIIRKFFNILEDRRVLSAVIMYEVAQHSILSVIYIRGAIVDTLNNLPPNSRAVNPLRRMGSACRKYIDNRRLEEEPSMMAEALDELRIIFGAYLLLLSVEFEVPVGATLQQIVPDKSFLPKLRTALTSTS